MVFFQLPKTIQWSVGGRLSLLGCSFGIQEVWYLKSEQTFFFHIGKSKTRDEKQLFMKLKEYLDTFNHN